MLDFLIANIYIIDYAERVGCFKHGREKYVQKDICYIDDFGDGLADGWVRRA